MASEEKVVWILGAGFSRSLGGPLLGDLFSQRKWVEIRERYPEYEQVWGSVEAKEVYALFAYGTRYAEGWFEERTRSRNGGVDMWRDAEHFLDYLDAAQGSSALQSSLGQLAADTHVLDGGSDPDKLTHAARRILAAECSVFLRDNPPGLERWDPYVRWMKRLTHADTVVTFNYDLVVETAGSAARREPHVLLSTDPHGPLRDAAEDKLPVLVKLHGSVDWEHAKPDAADSKVVPYRRSEDREYALTADFGTKMSICTPGSMKKQASTGDLARLWTYAEQRISEADAVIFLGYRFPPSDAESRRRLLKAVSDNKRPNHLTLRTVLGNDPSGEAAARRLGALLNYAAERGGREQAVNFSTFTDPLFVEDYLSVY